MNHRSPAVVDDVVRRDPSPTALAGQYLESPTVGSQLLPNTIEVSGWAVGATVAVRHVELTHRDRVLRQLPLDVPRPDVTAVVAAGDGEGRGYWGMLGLVGMPPDFDVEVIAVLADAVKTRIPLARLRGHRDPLSAGISSRLQPLLVTSLGRMGTTWMMRLLRAHPGVVVHDRHPHEMRAARYWMHMLHVLTEPANEHQSAERDSFARNTWEVGHNPMFGDYVRAEPELLDWLGSHYVDSVAQFCVDSIDGFYERVAGGLEGVRYFAEKSIPDQLPDIAADLYPGAREIFLVRDIRDTLCSILAFNRKRGYQAFGREMWGTDLAYMEQLGRTYARLARAWQARAASSRLVRYEDLAGDPRTALAGMLDYLLLDSGDGVVRNVLRGADGDDPALLDHRTSGDLEASVGRWRTDLEPGLQDHVEEYFGESLRVFGYQPK